MSALTEKKICGAKTKSGGSCQRSPMPNGRCRLHGGMTPVGPASANFKSGRYSKFLPARLQEQYALGRDDVDLLALREEIALLDARINDLVRRTDAGEAGSAWKALMEAGRRLKEAKARKDGDGVALALSDIMDCIARGQKDFADWNDILACLEARRKLVDTERRRLVDLNQMITAERAMTLLSAVVESVRIAVQKHCTDAQTARKILADSAADVRRLVDFQPVGPTERRVRRDE